MPDVRPVAGGDTPEQVLAGAVARLTADLADLRSTVLARTSLNPGYALASTSPKLLASTTSLGNVDFTGIPATYKHLMLTVQGATNRATEFDSERVTFNGDGGANYEFQNAQWTGAAADAPVQVLATTYIDVGTLPGSLALASASGSITILIASYADTNRYKSVIVQYASRGTTNLRIGTGSGLWRSTAAINRVQLGHLGTPVAGAVVSLHGLM